MSWETADIDIENIGIKTDVDSGTSSKSQKTRISPTVDINVLKAKLRDEKIKERKGNYIFLGIVCGAVAVTGIIASL